MTDILPYMVAATLAAASVVLFAAAIVCRQTWWHWRSPLRPHGPQECPAATGLANAAPALKPGEEGFA